MSSLKDNIKQLLPESIVELIQAQLERMASSIQLLSLLGFKQKCPICKWSFKQFLSFGYDNRPNVRCPKCGSLERHRLLFLYLEKHTRIFKDKVSVLHFAPQPCLRSYLGSLSNVKYTSTDIDPSRGDVTADASSLPFKDNSFDIIICYHVLQNVPDDIAAMKELSRVLKPDGQAITQDRIQREETYEDLSITSDEERHKAFNAPDYVRAYGQDYFDRLDSAGFNVETVKFSESFSAAEINKLSLKVGEEFYLCRQKSH